MRFPYPLLVLLILLSLPLQGFAASLAPLGMQDGRLLPLNAAEARFGLSYADRLHNLFQDQDFDRRLAEAPSLSLSVGLGERIEGQMHYNFLRLQRQGQGTEWGSGDLTLGVKLRLAPPREDRSALALRFAVKLPNADDEKDLGTDLTDSYYDLLATRSFARWTLLVNAGLAILGDPLKVTSGQDDLLRYGVGAVVPLNARGATLLLSAEGNAFGAAINDRGAVRAGVQLPLGDFTWDLGGSVGYKEKSENWSLRTGLTRHFGIPATW